MPFWQLVLEPFVVHIQLHVQSGLLGRFRRGMQGLWAWQVQAKPGV